MTRRSTQSGFTLVDMMITITVMGILAAIVVPKFLTANKETNTAAIKANLRTIRTQLISYYKDHNTYPTLADFNDQMTKSSDFVGGTADVGTPGYPYGPYIVEVPSNPETKTNDVGNGVVGSSAWFYNPLTGEFLANDSIESRGY